MFLRSGRKKEEQYIERVGELDRVTEVRNQQRDLCEEMKKTRLQEFMAVSDTFPMPNSALLIGKCIANQSSPIPRHLLKRCLESI